MPGWPELVAAFLPELAEQGLSVATLRLQKAALGRAHRSLGHPDPTDTEGVRGVMAGIAREHGRPQRQAKPLTEAALAAVMATAARPREHRGQHQGRRETSQKAQRRGRVDVALMSVLRDGLLRRSEAAELRWGDVAFQENGAALLQVRRSKTDPEAEGVVLYVGQEASQAPRALLPEGAGGGGPGVDSIRTLRQPGRPEGQGRGRGRGPGRRLHRPLGSRGDGPGPGRHRRGPARPDDRRPVEELAHAGQVHRAPGGGAGRGGQVLPEERELNSTISLFPGNKRRNCPAARYNITPLIAALADQSH